MLSRSLSTGYPSSEVHNNLMLSQVLRFGISKFQFCQSDSHTTEYLLNFALNCEFFLLLIDNDTVTYFHLSFIAESR